MGEKFSITWQRTRVAQNHIHILGCAKRFVISRSREEILTFCSALVRPRLECSVQVWGPHNKDVELLEGVQRAMKLIQGMKNLFCEERFREVGCSAWRSLRHYIWGHLTAIFQYLKSTYRKVGEGLFQRQIVMGQGRMGIN